MKKILLGILMIAIALAAFFWGLKMQSSNQEAQKLLDIELSATPTATADIRSVLLVTLDPNITPGPTSLLLKTGSKGDLVRKIQERLKDLKYYYGSVDGQFGPGTEDAVLLFQTQNGLTADGIVGETTYAAVMKESAPTCAPTATLVPEVTLLKRGDSGEAVRQMQQRLLDLEYYSGSVDGAFGPGTEEAVRIFQRQNGLEVDGIAAAKTFFILYSEDAPHMTVMPTPGPDDLLILINRSHPIDSKYIPFDLVLLSNAIPSSLAKVGGSEIEGDRTAVQALKTMLQAAKQEGLDDWKINSGYRSYQYQQKIFDDSVSDFMQQGYSRSKAESSARVTIADPGTSEHQTGLAFDISVQGVSQFKGTDQQIWLHQHCWDYGFIIRYQEDKEKITGYIAECWHIRYVGVQHSQKMREQNLCLEEYLGMVD